MATGKTNRKRLLAATVLAIVTSCMYTAFPQDRITGRVIEKHGGNPVPGAFIIAFSGSTQKSYTNSGPDGGFSLKVPEGTEINELRVSMMGYAPVSIPIKQDRTDIIVEMSEKKLELNSSKITSSVVEEHGDTLAYRVNAFSDGTEKVIGDLLEKLPGVSVTSSGGILYNGTYINKFYIEGLDLMGSRYGMVTKNLSADIVAGVEIYKNHQPVKALKDISLTDRSAVNIILKENAGNTWLFSGDAAAGFPDFPLFEARAMLSRFSKKSQSLFLLKGNNTGGDILEEVREQHYFGKTGAFIISQDNIDTDFQSVLNPKRTYLVLPKEFWYDNLSGVGSFNNLSKTGKGLQLRTSLQVAGEKYSEASATEENIHFTDGTSLSIKENNSLTEKKYYFSGTAAIENNSDRKYLYNELSVSGQLRFDDSFPSELYSQTYDLPSMKISNSLQMILRSGNKTAVSLSNESKYIRNSHSATYESGEDIFMQRYHLDDFNSKSKVTFDLNVRRHKIGISAGADIGYMNIESRLNQAFTDNAAQSGNLSIWSIAPEILLFSRFNVGKLQVATSVPAGIHCLLTAGKENIVYPSLSPSIMLKYRFLQNLEADMQATYTIARSGEESLLDAAVMKDYRTMERGDSLKCSKAFRAHAVLHYSDLPSMFFVSLSGNFNRQDYNRTVSNTYHETLTSSSYLPLPTFSANYGFTANVKKYFGVKTFVLEAEVCYRNLSFKEYLQGVAADYRDRGIETKLAFASNPAKWIAMSATGQYGYNKITGNVSTLKQSVQVEANIKATPFGKLSLESSVSYLWEHAPEATISNIPLLKCTASWSFSKFTVFAECRNLLDTKIYKREYISAYRTISCITGLYGRQFLAGIRMSL